MLKVLGENLKASRLADNLSQQVAADRSGISLKAIRNLEAGENASTLSLLSYYVVNIRILADYSVADVFCLLGLFGYAFAFRIRNLSLMRAVSFIPIILTLVFNIISDAALFATATNRRYNSFCFR